MNAKVNEEPKGAFSDFALRTLMAWGDIGAGKTMFALSCPFLPMLYLDMEGSSAAYRRFMGKEGIKFVDVTSPDMLRKTLGAVKAGEYTTIVMDGLAPVGGWFEEEILREQFRGSAEAAEKQKQLYWAAVNKKAQNLVLTCKGLASLTVMTAHGRGKYLNVKQREPRSLPGFIMYTDLCLELVKDTPNQRIPHGQTTHRNRYLQLPPRIPNLTWTALLEWLKKDPVDLEKLEASFMVPESLMNGIQVETEE